MRTQCPHCKTVFKTREEHEGKKTKCPKCKQPFVVVPFAEPTETEEACKNERKVEGKRQIFNRRQSNIIWIGIAVICAMLIFPPWQWTFQPGDRPPTRLYGPELKRVVYHFRFSPPRHQRFTSLVLLRWLFPDLAKQPVLLMLVLSSYSAVRIPCMTTLRRRKILSSY